MVNQLPLCLPCAPHPRILEAARCSHLTDAGFTLLARVREASPNQPASQSPPSKVTWRVSETTFRDDGPQVEQSPAGGEGCVLYFLPRARKLGVLHQEWGLALSLTCQGGPVGARPPCGRCPSSQTPALVSQRPSAVPGSASSCPPPTPAAQSRCPGADDSASCHVPQQPHCGERPTRVLSETPLCLEPTR